MLQLIHTSPVSPSRVVILGASGFIGSHLTARFKQARVETVAFSSSQLNLCQPESVGILRNALHSDDTLIVVSALTPDKGRDVRTLMLNLKMGEHLSDVLEQPICRHVIYLSSDAVYDDNAHLVRETSACNPSSFHGLMHLTREQMLTYALEKAKTPFAIVRPSLVYGPGDTHNGYGPNRFLRTTSQQEKIAMFGQGEEKRDHIFVSDVCRLIELCAAHQVVGILNLATGRAHSFMEVAETVGRVLDKPVQIETSPRKSPITHRHFDVTLLLKTFSTFTFTPLEEGLRQTIRAEA